MSKVTGITLSYDSLTDTPNLSAVATSGSYNDLIDTPLNPTALSSLTTDVTISSPATGQLLVYNGTKWTNTNTITASSQSVTPLVLQGTVSQLSPLFDIKDNLGTSLFTVSNNGTLTAGTVPVDRVSGLATVATTGSYTDLSNKPTIPTSLDGLSDAAVSSPQLGQLLVYNGSNFANSPYIQGNIVIGDNSAQNTRLGIVGSSNTSSSYCILVRDSTDNIMFYVRNDGLILTGDSANSPYNNDNTGVSANLYVNSAGTLQRASSSLKYKKDVVDAPHGLDKVLQLRYVNFKPKRSDNEDRIFGGMIAEEVHAAGLQEFVDYGTDGSPEGIHYANMVSLAFKAIQQLNEKIETLEARIAELESK